MTEGLINDGRRPPVFNPQRLEIVMKRRRVTPPELAERLKLKSSRMHKICFGISEPTDAEMTAISKALEWPIGFFYKTGDLSFDWCSI